LQKRVKIVGEKNNKNELMAYYIHQNGLMWSRLQTLIAVYTVFFGAVIALFQKNIDDTLLVVFLLFVTILIFVITFFLMFFMFRDRDIRNKLNKQLSKKGFNLNSKKYKIARSIYAMPVIFSLFYIIDLFVFLYLLRILVC